MTKRTAAARPAADLAYEIEFLMNLQQNLKW
jgi:hypothetical protein